MLHSSHKRQMLCTMVLRRTTSHRRPTSQQRTQLHQQICGRPHYVRELPVVLLVIVRMSRTVRTMTPSPALTRLIEDVQRDPALHTPQCLSGRAWRDRFAQLPTDVKTLYAADGVAQLADAELLAVLRVCARRLQYGFAHTLLLTFVADAHTLRDGVFADDPFLADLELFAECCTRGDRWTDLVARAETGGHVSLDLATTAAFVAPTVPEPVLERLLSITNNVSDSGCLTAVAAYRKVNLHRRLGNTRQAQQALDTAFAALLTSPIDPGFADHMSERLVMETLLLQQPPDN